MRKVQYYTYIDMLSYEICNRMAGHTCSSVLVPARIELLNHGNWGEHVASLVKLGETDLVPKFPYRHLVIDDCGGNYLLLRSVEYSYLKGQWPISRGDALEIDNKRVLRVGASNTLSGFGRSLPREEIGTLATKLI